ncbi:hypothetical protein BH11BAC7_BH11BAC7_11950 [soil metagenome]
MSAPVNYMNLVEVLRNYSTGNDEEYDVVAVLHLLKSCVGNMMINKNKLEFEIVKELYTPDQIKYMENFIRDLNANQ